MYPVQQPQVVPPNLYTVQTQNVGPRHRRQAKPLMGFGIAQLVFSILLFAWCLWIFSVDNSNVLGYMAMFSSLFHIVLSILAIVGGTDGAKFRCCVITCMVLGIIGACIMTIITLIPNAVIWQNDSIECKHCGPDGSYNGYYLENPCSSRCEYISSMYVPVAFFTFILFVFDIVISSITCCNVCRCCGCCYIDSSTPGYVLQPSYANTLNQPAYNPHPFNVQVFNAETAPLPNYEQPPPEEEPKQTYSTYPPAYNQIA